MTGESSSVLLAYCRSLEATIVTGGEASVSSSMPTTWLPVLRAVSAGVGVIDKPARFLLFSAQVRFIQTFIYIFYM